MATPSKSSVLVLTAFTDGVELTPVRKRHAHPSGSPIKSPAMAPPLKHLKSMYLSGTKPTHSQAQYDIPTAAVEFEGASCRGSDGRLDTSLLSLAQDRALMEYLAINFNAVRIDTSIPFLVIGCKGGPPPVDERPFSVAGLIAVWRGADDMMFFASFGYRGQGERITIDENIAKRIENQKAPPQDVVLHLAQEVFPTCIAISQIFTELVVELPPVDPAQFFSDLERLPSRIKGAGLNLSFHNGQLPGTERRRREVAPDSKNKDGVDDETDYMAKDGRFYPGSMVASVKPDGGIFASVTAGILIEKAGAERLICAYHCWEQIVDALPGLFGRTTKQAQEAFAVQQGKNPGTIVGFLRERVGKSDLGLAQLFDHVHFDNEFMEMEFRPKSLLKSYEVLNNDEYVFDSFTVGRTKVKCLGHRFEIERRPIPPPEPNAEELVLEPQVAYVRFEQGVYSANAPFLSQDPLIRNGVCGAVLLRCKNAMRLDEDERQTMERGEVAGIMRWDLVSQDPLFAGPTPSYAKFYLCYADAFDPLIDDGWRVAQVPVDEE